MLIEKWSKNHNELDASLQSYCTAKFQRSVDIAFFMNFTLQQLCEDASDHHSSLIIFDQHSMHRVGWFILELLQFFPNLYDMNSHRLSPSVLRFDGRPGTGVSDINFLTAGAIKLLSNAEITFSQAVTTDLPKEYSVSGLCILNYYFYLIWGISLLLILFYLLSVAHLPTNND